MDFKNNIDHRKHSLIKLLHNVKRYESEIVDALYKDFRKPAFESVITETSYVIADLSHTIKNIRSWSKPRRVLPSIMNFPSSDYIFNEPYGKVLVIAPWNYPFQLAMCPMIAAIAAGNSVVVKPSELTPATSAIVSKIIRETFDVKHVVAVLGDSSIAQDLLQKRWDYIFFTGSVAVGRKVAQAAAVHLTPVTLELGGKNPCIVDGSSDLKLAARRIVWGKFINAGQTCIAPDYILIASAYKKKFMELLQEEIIAAYGGDPSVSADFARIVNTSHFDRLAGLLEGTNVFYGGQTDRDNLYIAPSIIDQDFPGGPIMQDEIFGPLLPVLSYESAPDIGHIIGRFEKPLALYAFTEHRKFANSLIQKYAFGGGCINDTVIHFANKRLPFGGVGNSGTGAYHGRWGFDTFTHKKSVIFKGNWLDLPFRYAPYKDKLRWVGKLLKLIN